MVTDPPRDYFLCLVFGRCTGIKIHNLVTALILARVSSYNCSQLITFMATVYNKGILKIVIPDIILSAYYVYR